MPSNNKSVGAMSSGSVVVGRNATYCALSNELPPMGLTDPNQDLADQLVGLFARASAGEMPARVIHYRRDQVSRPAARVAGRGSSLRA